MQQNLLEQKLSRAELQDLRNKRTGLFIFQVSWIMIFVCLVIANWQLRYGATSWPPPGVEPLHWFLPAVATAALFVSALIARSATQALKADEVGRFLARWPLAIGLGAVFVVLVGYEWVTIPYSQIYSDVFRMMTGFHMVHAVVIGIFMFGIYRNARAGAYGSLNFWPVEGATSLWYFVLVAWLLFFVVLYLI
ncbi:MAG: cytochrome c oxidase subunit 3 [Anaerolineae bacterium]|nr:cytochrome c oxidase subunit 3 [Anaerolineae bacterium]